MPSLNMNGPFDLNSSAIENQVTRTAPGNYALGHLTKDEKTFIVNYVGRADDDVNGRIKDWVGKKTDCEKFKFSYATSAKAAFEKECRNYHDFGESDSLDNDVHPQRPDGCAWECPVCEVFD